VAVNSRRDWPGIESFYEMLSGTSMKSWLDSFTLAAKRAAAFWSAPDLWSFPPEQDDAAFVKTP
jgi:hypothetical protein